MGSKISGHKAGLVYCRISGDVKNCVETHFGTGWFPNLYQNIYFFGSFT